MDDRNRGTRARRLRRALALGSTALALAGGLAVTLSTGAGATAASPAWARAHGITLPTGGSAPAVLLGVDCTGTGFCAAAGDFVKVAANGSVPMVITSADGTTWAQARQLVLPKSAATVAKAAANDVACTSSTSCEVVGRFRYAANPAKNNAFIAVLTAAGWSRARTMALPANKAKVTSATLNRITCASKGNCAALGTYVDNKGDLATVAFTETGGTWSRGVELSPPADTALAGKQNVQPFGISCPAAGTCVAVGKYLSKTGLVKPFIATLVGGTWSKGRKLTLPLNAKTQAADLNAVSCSSVGNCTAVGNYTDKAGHAAAYSVSETGGTWGAVVQITGIAPGDSASPAAYHLYGLSCPADGACDTVGFYTNSSKLTSALSDAYSGSAWQAGTGVQAPQDSITTTAASTQLRDVSCWSQWSCVTVGSYINKGGHQQALIATSS